MPYAVDKGLMPITYKEALGIAKEETAHYKMEKGYKQAIHKRSPTAYKCMKRISASKCK